MALVSKHPIDEKLYKELYEQLVDLQSGLSRRQAGGLFSCLLTETEQIMLTKRCAAILMIAHDYSQYKVWNTLKLSSSTVARLSKNLNIGAYDDLLNIFIPKRKSKKDREAFIETLEKVLRLGMPEM